MTFRQFAFNNVVRNKRIYLAHFLSSSFSVMVFYIYALLQFHPKLQGELSSTSETLSTLGMIGMQVSQIIIFIFSFFFCLYSVSAFLKTRNREFGILMMHGMSPRQLHRLVFIENLIIGAASIVMGIGIGTVFAKLILLVVENILAIDNGLAFYAPWAPMLTTTVAFAVLFLIVSLFTSRKVKVGQLVDLFKSEEKPKPEPKASLMLSMLAVLFILAGYGMVFYFAINRMFSFPLLFSGVISVIIGTYFLFTQLSVYVIRAMKRNEKVFFKRINVLAISDLAYRMKDNATMFFMIAIVSAVAFTGIGTVLALGDPGLAEMENPYAFIYSSSSKNKAEEQDVQLIQQLLEDGGFAYEMLEVNSRLNQNPWVPISLSDYNQIAELLGIEQIAELDDGEAVLAPSYIMMQTDWMKEENWPKDIEILQDEWSHTYEVSRVINEIILPEGAAVAIISDAAFASIPDGGIGTDRYILFDVPDWKGTREIAQTLIKEINEDETRTEFSPYVTQLVLEWLNNKQGNGLLFIVSSMVGIVFFTFGASFLYFRLYTDLERDQRQYQLISKLGLTKREMSRTVTRQLMLMFFLPLLMALVHSGVAFAALQELVNFSVYENSVMIFVSFITIQIVYFLVIRWSYLQHMRLAMR
ncbi:FtsX-like permease family protein [Paenibacillus marinisediminis]